MKEYKKAVLIAKNLPTGSYAAGCPKGQRKFPGMSHTIGTWQGQPRELCGPMGCQQCEIAE